MLSVDAVSVEEARQRILDHIPSQLSSEEIPLTSAVGRTLAENVVAGEALPPFTNSAMDGYAVRSVDTSGATASSPVVLRLVGEVPAGRIYPGRLQSGEALRILTGAVLPDGSDSVIQQELTQAADSAVSLLAEASPGMNVRPAGDDVRVGELLVLQGTELGPAEIGLLAALGIHPVRVRRQPQIAILSTGDELAPLGTAPVPGQIRESNALYLSAAVQRAGGVPLLLGVARDRPEEIRSRLQAAKGVDMILTSGGVSVGDYDLVKQILAEQGTIDFWRVQMRPGKPLAFGMLGELPLLGLPGNPVSAAVTFELFGRPAIRKMLGSQDLLRPVVEVVLEGRDIEREDRRQFVRVRLHSRAGTLVATTTGSQGSHRMHSLLGANALLIILEGEGTVRQGDHVPALLLDNAWANA